MTDFENDNVSRRKHSRGKGAVPRPIHFEAMTFASMGLKYERIFYVGLELRWQKESPHDLMPVGSLPRHALSLTESDALKLRIQSREAVRGGSHNR